MLIGIMLTATTALADEALVPTVTNVYFTTNYSVGSSNYMKGGSTIRVNATIGNINNDTAGYYNVSAKIYNATGLIQTLYLANTTTNLVTAQTWTGTFTAPAYDISATTANITINASYTNTTNDYLENSTQKVSYKVDASNPAVSSTTPSSGYQIKGYTGISQTISSAVTDNAGITSATITWSTVPTGSAFTSNTMTCDSGSTSVTCTYAFVPDITGTYAYTVTVVDNVTNSVTTSAYTIYFTLPNRQLPPTLLPSGTTSETPTGFLEAGQGIITAIMNIPNAIMNAISNIGNLFNFNSVMSIFR